MIGAQPAVSGAGGGGYSGEIKDELQNKSSASQQDSTTTDVTAGSGAGNRGFIFNFNRGGNLDAAGAGQGINPPIDKTSSWLWIAAGLALIGLVGFVILKLKKG